VAKTLEELDAEIEQMKARLSQDWQDADAVRREARAERRQRELEDEARRLNIDPAELRPKQPAPPLEQKRPPTAGGIAAVIDEVVESMRQRYAPRQKPVDGFDNSRSPTSDEASSNNVGRQVVNDLIANLPGKKNKR